MSSRLKTKVGDKVRVCYDAGPAYLQTSRAWIGSPWTVKHVNSDGTLFIEHLTRGGTLHRQDNVRSWVRA